MRSRSPADVRPSAPRRWLLAALGALLVAAACAGGDAAPVRVTVPVGASLAVAAESLESAGVVRSARLFRLYAEVTGRDRSIKAGTYELRPGTSWASTLDALTKGRGLSATVTIPEGWSLREIEPALARALAAPPESVSAAVRDSALRARLQVPTETLEGYLFPETYTWPVGTPPREAVETMVAEFERRWKPEWDARLDSLGWTRHQAVTLAAIVEKEARLESERPTIAAVYHNRLRIGMPLQADPTVVYALPERVDRVLYKHLETDSPYNTYRVKGLPPGPIASPGSASLDAALNPADVPYLYFVAHPDGHHEFRTTFAEHAKAREQVRRAQAQRTPAADAPAPARKK